MSNNMPIAWQDARAIACLPFIPWDEAAGKTFVVTGATGLIGGTIARALSARNSVSDSKIKIVAPVRDVARASEVLSDLSDIVLVAWDALVGDSDQILEADYVLHCAAPTSSRFFAQFPIETIQAVIAGTQSMLDLADRCGASFVLASSMEVYGAGSNASIDESSTAGMDTQNPRNSYPAAKVAAEALCTAYSWERGLRSCVARLAQSFGPGVLIDDQRVFAEFARSCIYGSDICLHTDGKKLNTYVYSADAAAALLLLGFRGVPGCAYNVANESTLVSIREMAESAAKRFGAGRTKVTVQIDEERARSFRPDGTLNLDSSRLRSLGWTPSCGLMDMYDRLIRSWQEAQ